MSTATPTRTRRARVVRLAEAVCAHELDWLLVTGQVNVRYVTGFTGSTGLALVAAGADHVHRFFTDFRYVTQAREEVADAFQRETVVDNLMQGVAAALGPDGGRLGFLERDLTVADHSRLAQVLGERWELIASAEIVERLRRVKDASEIELIRAASELADEAMTAVLEGGLVGRTESDIALELELQMRRRGAEGASFPAIVAAGPHGALPHAHARDEQIPRDVLVTVDWGARHDGYCSDCTRTYATGEQLDERAREVYELVRSAQQLAVEATRPGLGARALDAVARAVIEAAGFGEQFGHGLGHGVGMEVHEPPRLARAAPDDPLEPGNVVTIEPGVYAPDELGVRIEDLLVVTPSGSDVLTRLSKELIVAT
jgi:Xaa-Pro aminopeptidase